MKTILKKTLGEKTYWRVVAFFMAVYKFWWRLHERLGAFKYSKVALNDLDNKLMPYLNFRHGFFIEAGANDGVTQSNTYYLEKALGWHGILIEPLPRLFSMCKKNRPNSTVYNCALVSPEKEGTAVTICETEPAGLLSKIVEGDKIPDGIATAIRGKTLTSVLSETFPKKIDFFSLDVEGYEIPVLNGLDLSKFKPKFILVETAQVQNVDSILLPHYSRISQLTCHDYLYQLKDTN